MIDRVGTLVQRSRQLLERQTARGALGSFALRIGATGMGFVTSLLLARLLGAEGYGRYAYAISWVYLLSMPALFGFHELLVREVATYKAQRAWGQLRALLRWSDLLVLGTSLGLVALTGAVVWWRLDPPLLTVFLTALLALPLLTLTQLRQASLRGLRDVIASQIPEMLLQPLLIVVLVLSAYAVLGERFDALWAMVATVVAAGSAFAVATYLRHRALHRALPERSRTVTVTTRSDTTRWLRSALPFLFIAGMYVINSRADIIMLGIFRDEASVGIYAVVVKAALLMTFILGAINTALAPLIAGLHVKNEADKLGDLIRQSTLVATLGSLPILAAFIVFGELFLGVFGAEFQQGYVALVILSCGQFANASTGSVGQLLSMTGHERDTASAVAIGALLNVILNALLIPPFGLIGAATATACSIALWNAVLGAFVYHRFGFFVVFGLVTFRKAPSH